MKSDSPLSQVSVRSVSLIFLDWSNDDDKFTAYYNIVLGSEFLLFAVIFHDFPSHLP